MEQVVFLLREERISELEVLTTATDLNLGW